MKVSRILVSSIFLISFKFGFAQTDPTNTLTTQEIPDTSVVINGEKFLIYNGIAFKVEDSIQQYSNLGNNINLALGYNFDFLDGIDGNQLYINLHGNFNNIFRSSASRKNAPSKFGLSANIYQLRTVSTLDSVNEQFRDIEPDIRADTIFQLFYITNDVARIDKTVRENLGVSIRPRWNFFSRGKDLLYLSGHFELLRSVYEASTSRNVIGIDTSSTPPPDWPIPYMTTNSIPTNNETNIFEYNINYGLGLGMDLTSDIGDIRSTFTFVRNQIQQVNSLSSQLVPDSINSWSYIFQVEFFEKKYAGIKIGTEVRSNLRSIPILANDPINRSVPFFSVYIAKIFSFKKVGEFFTP